MWFGVYQPLPQEKLRHIAVEVADTMEGIGFE
jgi:hypothetical protein